LNTSAALIIDVSPGVVIASAPCAVCRTVLDSGLERFSGEQSVNQSGRKGIATPHSIEDLETLTINRVHDIGFG
jgi:hypothetical protein